MDFKNLNNFKNILYNVNLVDFVSSASSNLTILYFSNKPYDKINIINSYNNIIYVSKYKSTFSGTTLKKINRHIISHLLDQFVIFIDIDNNVSIKYMKYLLTNLISLFKLLNKYKIKFNYVYNNSCILSVLSFDQQNLYFNDIIACFNALISDSREEAYSIIYDHVCNYLDSQFCTKNLCNFCNDECIASRNGFTQNKKNGCCYSYIYGPRRYYNWSKSLRIFAKQAMLS